LYLFFLNFLLSEAQWTRYTTPKLPAPIFWRIKQGLRTKHTNNYGGFEFLKNEFHGCLLWQYRNQRVVLQIYQTSRMLVHSCMVLQFHFSKHLHFHFSSDLIYSLCLSLWSSILLLFSLDTDSFPFLFSFPSFDYFFCFCLFVFDFSWFCLSYSWVLCTDDFNKSV